MSTAYLQDASIRRRATSMKQFKNHQSSIDRQYNKKSFTLNKRSSHIEGSQQGNTFFSIFGDKRRTRDPETAMDLLDEQIARIRGTLEQMKTEDKHIGERVAMVTAAVDAASASSSSSNCSSLESIEEQTSSCTKTLSTSTSSLPTCNDSKRDSGFIYDPAFEMCDTQRNCMPNNFVKLDPTKKARSTTAVDFIRNNLHEDCGQRLKATSIDRLSCYSDSALLSIPGLRYR